jgi:hypothetical protein
MKEDHNMAGARERLNGHANGYGNGKANGHAAPTVDALQAEIATTLARLIT